MTKARRFGKSSLESSSARAAPSDKPTRTKGSVSFELDADKLAPWLFDRSELLKGIILGPQRDNLSVDSELLSNSLLTVLSHAKISVSSSSPPASIHTSPSLHYSHRCFLLELSLPRSRFFLLPDLFQVNADGKFLARFQAW